jgi:hypothetical protein
LSNDNQGLNIRIDPERINLTPNDIIYEIRLVGYTVNAPPANQRIRLRNSAGNVTYGQSDVLATTANAPINITSTLPTAPTAAAHDVIRVQVNPRLPAGAELNIRITSIEIEAISPR